MTTAIRCCCDYDPPGLRCMSCEMHNHENCTDQSSLGQHNTAQQNKINVDAELTAEEEVHILRSIIRDIDLKSVDLDMGGWHFYSGKGRLSPKQQLALQRAHDDRV